MISSVAQVNPTPPVTSDAAVAAPTTTSKEPAPSAVPQDTVTISDQAQAQSLSASASPPNITASVISSLASSSSASSTSLAIQEQVQSLANQGWSVNQIASNLNVSVTTVELYVSPAPAETSNNTAASATAARIPFQS